MKWRISYHLSYDGSCLMLHFEYCCSLFTWQLILLADSSVRFICKSRRSHAQMMTVELTNSLTKSSLSRSRIARPLLQTQPPLECLTTNHEAAGSIPGTSTNFKCGLGLERGPPSLVRTIRQLLDGEVADLIKKVDIIRLDGA